MAPLQSALKAIGLQLGQKLSGSRFILTDSPYKACCPRASNALNERLTSALAPHDLLRRRIGVAGEVEREVQGQREAQGLEIGADGT